MKTIYSMNEISHIDKIKYLPVSGKDQAQTIFDNRGYSIAWYYQPRKNTRWLIVRKEEYNGE